MNKKFIFMAIGGLLTAAGIFITKSIIHNKKKKTANPVTNCDNKIEEIANTITDEIKVGIDKISDTAKDASESFESFNNIISLMNDYNCTSEESKGFPDPYLIKPEEYGSGNEPYNDYAYGTLYYNANEDILFDSDGNIIHHKSYLSGDNFKKIFEAFDEENDVIYIRNERVKCEYEVILTDDLPEDYYDDETPKITFLANEDDEEMAEDDRESD